MAINRSQPSQAGVTLMEMLITVTIISILMATVIPSYTNRVRQANRTDATSALLELAAAQEKFYLRNSRYSADINELGASTSLEDMYSLSVVIDSPVVGGFTVSAVAISAMQIKDSDCRIFRLDHTGRRTAVDVVSQITTETCW